ncbi:hypothetical protein ABT336_20495 [Micromonospora sp. NPDC000207]|uniref:hypothetical protein n=1 Tax=Micromonospora sp. NPDC000207 TaxID=3154246 RepID=UPI00332182D8
MTNLSGVRAAAVLPLFLLALAACAAEPGDTSGDAREGGPPSYGADEVVLRIDQEGGFVMPTALVTRLPNVSVYGDGRIVTEGPVVAKYPGPALPNVQVTTVDAEKVTRLVEQAREAGVGTAADLGAPPVADVPSTRFTVRGATGVEETEVQALDVDSGLTADQVAAREKLRTFAQSLIDTGQAAGTGGTKAYQPTAVAAVVTPWTADEAAGEQPKVAWPGPKLPGAPLAPGVDLSCVTVTGDQVRPLLDAAGKANAATPWTSGGKSWTVALRPLLPDETDCADLAAAR